VLALRLLELDRGQQALLEKDLSDLLRPLRHRFRLRSSSEKTAIVTIAAIGARAGPDERP
jgi:hypothetical protein